MNNDHLQQSLASARSLIKDLGNELEETNRGLISLTLELESAKEKYKNIFENSIEGIFQISADGKKFLLCNPALLDILKFDTVEDLKKCITDISGQLFDKPGHFHKLLNKLSNGIESIIRTELQIRRADGSHIWVGLSLYKIPRDPDQPIRYYEGSMIDINDRVNYEKRLKASVKEKENLLEVFVKFVPREFINYLKHDKLTRVKVGDQVQEKLTVLFADINAFTAMSDSMSMKENFDLLNEFLQRVSPCVRNHGGIIDKYVGDALMALFPGKSDNAIHAGIEMQKVIRDYNLDRMKNNLPSISFCIGMHHGEVQLGIVGDDDRLQATVISDTVNKASRIVDLAKTYQASLMISRDLYNNLKRKRNFNSRTLGWLEVKGYTKPISVFEIIDGDLSRTGILKKETRNPFNKAIKKYMEGNYDEASLNFNRILKDNPEDHAARIYLEKSAAKMVAKGSNHSA